MIARLVPMWPDETADGSLEGRRRLVALIERALRRERRRGVAGHWSYDLARHAQLLELYREEKAMLAEAKTHQRRLDRAQTWRVDSKKPATGTGDA